MPGMLHHETLYRGADGLSALADRRVTLCGAGALGSHLADNLVRQGWRRLRVVDDDRVEEHNVGTQAYGCGDVGALKVNALQVRVFRATGVEIETQPRRLDDRTVGRLLDGSDIVVDALDNTASRQLVQDHARRTHTETLHAGLSADYAEVVWDDAYQVPSEAGLDVCDYPLARNLVLLAVAIASETLNAWALRGERRSWSATLGDLAVRPLEA